MGRPGAVFVIAKHSAVNHTGFLPEAVEDVSDHRGGCGFAGGAADGDALSVAAEYFFKQIGSFFDGDVVFASGLNVRVFFINDGGNVQTFGIGENGTAVLWYDFQTDALQSGFTVLIESFVKTAVGSINFVAFFIIICSRGLMPLPAAAQKAIFFIV